MADTLSRYTHDRHFNSINIAHSTLRRQDFLTMRRPRVQKKLSKLQLLQKDYRSRLLYEKEQKLNVLLDQRIRENSNKIPKKGSVREFFLNRRMLAANPMATVRLQNGVTLPPILRNSRYDGARSDKKRFVDQERLPNTKEVEGVNPGQALQFGITKENDALLSEIIKLRKGRRKGQGLETEIDPATLYTAEPKEKGPHPNISSINHGKQTAGRPERKNTVAAAAAAAHRKKPHSEEVYKRGTKTSHELASSNDSSKHAAVQMEQSWCTKTELSKSLVKIKELSRRKTEEMLQLRTTTTTLPAERKHSQPTPRREDSRNIDDMCKLETELRETISRERKKLLALKQRKEKMRGETTKETSLGGGRAERNPRSNKLKATRSSVDKESTNNMDDTRDRASHEDASKRSSPSSTGKRSTQIGRSPEPENAVSTDSLSATGLLQTCSNCGRRFMKERISKHENACKKASARKKKPFDARRKRAEGTDMEEYLNVEKKTSEQPAKEKKKKNWRIKHENFIQTIRYAKGLQDKPPPPLANPDYIECSYCRRTFSPSVAERHIPKCKDRRFRSRPPKH